MSFLKSLFAKDTSKKDSCCDIKFVEVKEENAAAVSSSTPQSNTAEQK